MAGTASVSWPGRLPESSSIRLWSIRVRAVANTQPTRTITASPSWAMPPRARRSSGRWKPCASCSAWRWPTPPSSRTRTGRSSTCRATAQSFGIGRRAFDAARADLLPADPGRPPAEPDPRRARRRPRGLAPDHRGGRRRRVRVGAGGLLRRPPLRDPLRGSHDAKPDLGYQRAQVPARARAARGRPARARGASAPRPRSSSATPAASSSRRPRPPPSSTAVQARDAYTGDHSMAVVDVGGGGGASSSA